MEKPTQTRLGPVQGLEHGGVQVFRGLPFAVPPVGPLRWLPPQPAAPWAGTLDATRFPNRCPQPPYAEVLSGFNAPGEQSEDCLYLNIFTPAADGRARPVLCWIHGGAYMQGAANEYDGSVLAREQDVVVVAINYRLGAFGFCNVAGLGPDYAGSGNRGLEDQVAALRWIRDNIADYGGDPGCVTICGESAGAGSVLALQGVPAADGLYHRAMACSAGDIGQGPLPDASGLLAQHLGLEGDPREALLAVPAGQLVALQVAGLVQPNPCVDGVVVTRTAREAIAARGADGPPLLIGNTCDEGSFLADLVSPDPAVLAMVPALYAPVINPAAPADWIAHLDAVCAGASPRERMVRTWQDLFRSAGVRNAAAASVAGAGGWLYSFEVPTDHPLGTTHASEIPFTFNSFASTDAGRMLLFHPDTPDNRALARLWSAAMVQFARSGDPNGAGLPEWPQYVAGDRACLVFDAAPHVVRDPDGAAALAAYGAGG